MIEDNTTDASESSLSTSESPAKPDRLPSESPQPQLAQSTKDIPHKRILLLFILILALLCVWWLENGIQHEKQLFNTSTHQPQSQKGHN